METHRTHGIIPSVPWVKERTKALANILSKCIYILKGSVESVTNVLTKVLERLLCTLEGGCDILSQLLPPVAGSLRGGSLTGDLIGDLRGDRGWREIIGEDVVIRIRGILLDSLRLLLS